MTHTFNYSLNTSLLYSQTTDYITNITDTLSSTASFITLKNLATQEIVSLNISYPFSPTEWWNVFTNFNAFHLENHGEFEGEKVVDVSTNTVNLYMQNTFSLPADFSFEVSGWYQSPSIWGGNFETDALWSLDAGFKKKLFDGRATVNISVSDIFKTTDWRGQNEFGALKIDARGGNDSRRFKVNFSYLIGNDQVKGSRNRKAGLEEENSRISTNN